MPDRDTTALTPSARKALDHYQAQAARLRQIATKKRARAEHVDEYTREVFLRHADDIDRQADEWDALAAELEAFADQQTAEQEETLL